MKRLLALTALLLLTVTEARAGGRLFTIATDGAVAVKSIHLPGSADGVDCFTTAEDSKHWVCFIPNADGSVGVSFATGTES